ncbi:hypothetical protein RHMOL_Rhmol09G0171500 [Rhododendron molle]|uniref:Uncharacterized protein n=1 Tax=Rhododendron molle TaxID=49168 RepID=A0ACC0ME48_RHOML|nr:hypothetical protein RHMOL_Rhmol09G0171500 [Rhododendron molle]
MEKVSSKMVLLAILLLTVSGLEVPKASGAKGRDDVGEPHCQGSLDCRSWCSTKEYPRCVDGFCTCEIVCIPERCNRLCPPKCKRTCVDNRCSCACA